MAEQPCRARPGWLKLLSYTGARICFQGSLVCAMGQAHFCTKTDWLGVEFQGWCGTALSQPSAGWMSAAAPACSDNGFLFAGSTQCHCLLSLGPTEPWVQNAWVR